MTDQGRRSPEPGQTSTFVPCHDGVLLLDLDGRVVDLNAGAPIQLGVPREKIVGRRLDELCLPESHGSWAEAQKCLRQGGRALFPIAFGQSDGSRKAVEASAGFVNDSAGERVQVVLRELVARKAVQEEIAQTQKLELLGLLAGGVAHDFNNILTVVLGYSEMALRTIGEDDPLHSPLREIHRAARHGSTLTRQLLAFSRKQVAQPAVLDPNHVLEALYGILRRLIGEGIRIETALDPAAGRILIDRGQLEQAILNLVVNARDAMPEGGTLTLETGPWNVEPAADSGPSALPPGPYVRLTVRDTGCGMDESTLRRICEPFFTTKRTGSGTGLGLSTVDWIARQYGGTLRVESTVGKGSVFSILFPRSEGIGQASTEFKAAEPSRLCGWETVLVVEDDVVVRRLTTRILKGAGYQVLEASDGEDALRVVEGHSGVIHLLVTDVVMERMNGPQLAERLAQRRPGTPVLYVSGYPGSALGIHPRLSEEAFLSKPVGPKVLLEKVRTILTANRPVVPVPDSTDATMGPSRA